MTSPTSPVPIPPPRWTPETVIAYLASFALFVIGILTLAGLTIPTQVASDIQLFSGAAVSVIGGLISVVVYIYRSLLRRTAIAAAIAAGYDPALAMRL